MEDPRRNHDTAGEEKKAKKLKKAKKKKLKKVRKLRETRLCRPQEAWRPDPKSHGGERVLEAEATSQAALRPYLKLTKQEKAALKLKNTKKQKKPKKVKNSKKGESHCGGRSELEGTRQAERSPSPLRWSNPHCHEKTRKNKVALMLHNAGKLKKATRKVTRKLLKPT